MVRLSKKVEYALISLRHISVSNGNVISAKEISANYNIPYELLAKVLQKLKKDNILASVQGTNGGYKLIRTLNTISLSELIEVIEGSKGIVECQQMENPVDCCISELCNIKSPIIKMQRELETLLKSKKISEFI